MPQKKSLQWKPAFRLNTEANSSTRLLAIAISQIILGAGWTDNQI